MLKKIGYHNYENVVGIDETGMSRLARTYAKSIKQRKAKELQNERALDLQPFQSQFEVAKKKLAEQLERQAEEVNGHLPVASVFDALQTVKAHKDLPKDIGLRSLAGQLDSMWKRDRQANISANSFINLKEHYTRNYPKSKVAEVFGEIARKGYFTLPVSDLLHIASQIKSQEDYDSLIVKHGFQGKQPHQVKARKFILAAVNGDASGEDVADWLVRKMQWEMGGGDPEEFRRENPPPNQDVREAKKAQEFDNVGYRDTILEGAARAFFVDSWMTAWEALWEDAQDYDIEVEVPGGPGEDLMDIAPPTPPEAFAIAEEFLKEVEQDNQIDLENFIPSEETEAFDRDSFGHYLAMEYMGHGVSWSDDHEDHGLKIPYGETPYDLGYAGDSELQRLSDELYDMERSRLLPDRE